MRINRGAVVILAVAGSVAWSALAARSSAVDTVPWRQGSLAQRLETQPVATGIIKDRNGAILAQPVFDRSSKRPHWVIERQNGRPLGNVGLGRDFLLPYGVHGNLSGATRTGAESLRGLENQGVFMRMLVGEAVLTAPALPPTTLSIDASLTMSIYQILAQRGGKGSAVVVNARSGEVLSLADFPGPDVTSSNAPTARDSLDAMHGTNLLASTMKTLSAAYVLTKRPADAENGHECTGDRCWMRHGRVRNLRDALVNSCNTWFRRESAKWDRADWLAFLLDTGLQPADVPGMPLSPILMVGHQDNRMHWPHAVGQQIWVSMVGLAAAYATVTSPDGRRVNPAIVSGTEFERGTPQVVSPTTAQRIREMLWATARIGTAQIVNQTYVNRNAGGKTGTGERDGATSDAVFAAVAPWNEPQWIVVVSLKGGGRGTLAGRVAGEILNELSRLTSSRPVR